MTDKTYYQAAANEVAHGCIDAALWTKVNADMPGATDVVRQAKYIQLRAREMAAESHVHGIARRAPRTWWQWILYAVAAFVVANLLAVLFDNSAWVAYGALVVAAIAPLVIRRPSQSQRQAW